MWTRLLIIVSLAIATSRASPREEVLVDLLGNAMTVTVQGRQSWQVGSAVGAPLALASLFLDATQVNRSVPLSLSFVGTIDGILLECEGEPAVVRSVLGSWASTWGVPATGGQQRVTLLPGGGERITRRMDTEPLCTENLWPVLTFLGCAGNRAARGLVSPIALQRALRRTAEVQATLGTDGRWSVATRLTYVVPYDPAKDLRTLLSPTAEPLDPAPACPAYASSRLYVLARGTENRLTLTPEPAVRLPLHLLGVPPSDGTSLYMYDSIPTDLHIVLAPPRGDDGSLRDLPAPPRVTMRRHFVRPDPTSTLLELHASLDNPHGYTVNVTVEEDFPNTLEVHWHTWEFSGRRRIASTGRVVTAAPVPTDLELTLPATAAFTLALPAHSTATYAVSLSPRYFTWSSYPPDAHRSYIALGPRVTTAAAAPPRWPDDLTTWSPFTEETAHLTAAALRDVLATEQDARTRRRQHTHMPHSAFTGPPATFALPTPDFSMPYNVIVVSGTLLSLLIGNVFAATTAHHSSVYEGGRFVRKRPIGRLVGWLRAKLTRAK